VPAGSAKAAASASATVASAASAPPTAATATGTPDKFDMAGNKGPLLSRLRSGKASMQDLLELKAICMADGDRACRNEAVAAIAKMKSQ
jgi:hypothetical protein